MTNIPTHIAFIVDGNRRWAKEHKLTSYYGHKHGFDRLEDIIDYAVGKGVSCISCFVFSTENFNRDPAEIDYLMKLFCDNFERLSKKLKQENIKAIFSGRKNNLLPEVLVAMELLESETEDCNKAIVNFCLNYGGQTEIIDACKSIGKEIAAGNVKADAIDISLFETHLYQQLPPIDLLIRTSGEIRISNFMLWQLAYAEMYFTDLNFPDFTQNELDKALASFNKRNRRFGGNTV